MTATPAPLAALLLNTTPAPPAPPAPGLLHFDLDLLLGNGSWNLSDDGLLLVGGGSNVSAPRGDAPPGGPYAVWQAVLLALVLIVLCVGTVLGNILVCTAVCIVRKLRTPSNLLIVSLAVSDFLVGLLVMPFAATYEVMGRWVLGQTMCDAWTSLDVMLCTASILNLCAISIDRYFVITRPFQYAMKRTPRRMALMIAAVWLSSGLISIPPLFGWKSEAVNEQCSVSQAVGYQFYATIGAFYLPLTVMIVVYYRIYMVSAKISQAEAKSKPASDGHFHSGVNTPMRKNSEENHNAIFSPPHSAGSHGSSDHSSVVSRKTRVTFNLFKKSSLNKISNSKERKATKTLGVIMGAFTACWLPFFILALVRPFCADCIPRWLSAVFLWLGYANSFLNPIIYARFNRDFRTPFKEIILCRCRGINSRLRSESYAEQYGGRGGGGGGGGAGALRDCLRPPCDTVVRYDSHGHTIVNLGNGAGDSAGAAAGKRTSGKRRAQQI